MIRILSVVLLFLSAIVFGQEESFGLDFERTSIVKATEVEVDSITRFIEAIYTVFDPLHKNADFPLYAYDLDDVIRARPCDSFGDVPENHQFAFVSSVSQDRETKEYLGVQVTEAAQIRDICNILKSSPHILADEIDEDLFTAETQSQVFNEMMNQGGWHRSDTELIWTDQCVKPFKAATAEYLPGKSIHSDGGDVANTLSGIIPQLTDETGWASAVSGEWRNVEDPEAFRAMTEQVAEKLGVIIARIPKLQGAQVLAGQLFVTSYPKKDFENGETEMPTASTGPGFNLTAWYRLPFCSAGAGYKWYVMSDRPLRHVKSDFRSWLASEP